MTQPYMNAVNVFNSSISLSTQWLHILTDFWSFSSVYPSPTPTVTPGLTPTATPIIWQEVPTPTPTRNS